MKDDPPLRVSPTSPSPFTDVRSAISRPVNLRPKEREVGTVASRKARGHPSTFILPPSRVERLLKLSMRSAPRRASSWRRQKASCYFLYKTKDYLLQRNPKPCCASSRWKFSPSTPPAPACRRWDWWDLPARRDSRCRSRR